MYIHSATYTLLYIQENKQTELQFSFGLLMRSPFQSVSCFRDDLLIPHHGIQLRKHKSGCGMTEAIWSWFVAHPNLDGLSSPSPSLFPSAVQCYFCFPLSSPHGSVVSVLLPLLLSTPRQCGVSFRGSL